MGYLKEAAERIDAGETIPASVERIFDAGSGMGSTRPKAVMEDNQRQCLAKFALASDPFAMPQVEYATLLMAKAGGLSVPELRLEHIGDAGQARPIMLTERFDRHLVMGGNVGEDIAKNNVEKTKVQGAIKTKAGEATRRQANTKNLYARRHVISARTM